MSEETSNIARDELDGKKKTPFSHVLSLIDWTTDRESTKRREIKYLKKCEEETTLSKTCLGGGESNNSRRKTQKNYVKAKKKLN